MNAFTTKPELSKEFKSFVKRSGAGKVSGTKTSEGRDGRGDVRDPQASRAPHCNKTTGKREQKEEAVKQTILKLLVTPMTPHDVVRASGMHAGRVYRYINNLYAEHRIYVADWTRKSANGMYAKMYLPGCLPDKPSPLEIAEQERARQEIDNTSTVRASADSVVYANPWRTPLETT